MSYTLTWDLGSGDSLITFNYFDTANNAYEEMPMQYALWANTDPFTEFYDWANDESESPTTNEETNSLAYQSYSLQIECDLSYAGQVDGSGCCLIDASSLLGGGYCLIWNDGDSQVDTYFLTDTEMDDAVDSGTI